jgi:hypothetical protein
MNLIDYNFKLNSIIKDGLLNTNEIALMFVIINLQNTIKTELFGLPTRTTSAHLNLSLPTYYRALESLQSKGLIDILEQGKKNQAPIIRIKFDKGFDKKILANTLTISDSIKDSIKENEQMLLKNFSESVNINKKEEKRKNNLTNNSSIYKSEIEPFEKLRPNDCKEFILEQIQIHKEQIEMSIQKTEDKLIRSLDYFIQHFELENKIYNFKSESWKHFINWVKFYDIDKQAKNKVIFEKKSKRFETFEELKKSVNGNT